MTKTVQEVLRAHWSASTHTDRKPFVDKCDGCGAVIFSWGDPTVADGSAQLATHQAAALTAAGYGLVADAKRGAWDEGYRTGKSRAMRAMSDEPHLSLYAPNPYLPEGEQ